MSQMCEFSLENKENCPSRRNVSFYFLAKDAEFQLRNLKVAEFYYGLAIKNNERVNSAVKDLATVMHQRGRTEAACQLLQEFKPFYRGDQVKYDNLLRNLKKQIQPTGNCHLKKLLVVAHYEDCRKVQDLFGNFSRIQNIQFFKDQVFLFERDRRIFAEFVAKGRISAVRAQNPAFFCYLLSFTSFSQAKKTLDTLKTSIFPVFWVSDNGRVCAKALRNQGKLDQKRNRAAVEPVWKEVLCFLPQKTRLSAGFSRSSRFSTKDLQEIWENSFEFRDEAFCELALLEKHKENETLLRMDQWFPSILSQK